MNRVFLSTLISKEMNYGHFQESMDTFRRTFRSLAFFLSDNIQS